MKDKIIAFIEGREEYPDMNELVNEFLGSHQLFEDVLFLKAIVELIQDQRIAYQTKGLKKGLWLAIYPSLFTIPKFSSKKVLE